MTRQEIMAELLKLDAEERIELAEFLWGSIGEEDPPLTDQQVAELERRMKELEDNPSIGIPWEQVRADLRKKFD